MTRLIDADKLKAQIPTIEDEYKYVHKLIDNAPAVGVVVNTIEVRPQGEWVEKEETRASVSYHCSNCKVEGIPITPFCPWCGASMRNY